MRSHKGSTMVAARAHGRDDLTAWRRAGLRAIIRGMRLLAGLFAMTVLAGQAYPPPYPRAGTIALIDNTRVLAWDVSWPKGQPSAMHRHLYDMTGLYYWPGDRDITAVDGSTRRITTKAGAIQWQLKGITHIEEGTSDDPLRAVMIEIKGEKASGRVAKVAAPIAAANPPLLDNARVTVWDYTRPAHSVEHGHSRDMVVVWTAGRAGHAVFVPAGTVHADEPIGPATTATMFELK
jgi:hypothetical protein